MNGFEQNSNESRRSFVRKAAYVAPIILTLKAEPSFASHGSGASSKAHGGGHGNNGVGNGIDPAPPGNPPQNDGAGSGPGNPGNRRKQ